MKFEIAVFDRGKAGGCDVVGCHNKAEFRITPENDKPQQYICNYHVGPCIRRMAKGA